MKKFRTMIALLLATLSLTACTGGNFDDYPVDIDFDIFETKNIVLGDEVDSVELTTKDGEKITFTNTAGFYEIFDEIGHQQWKDGKKYSCHAEMKLDDQSKSFVNSNFYYLDGANLDVSRVKKEGSEDVALIEKFGQGKQLENGGIQHTVFERYIYKEEKAFGGSITGTNGNTYYQSNKYPIVPEQGTELNEMQVRAGAFTTILRSTAFFVNYEPIGEMDFNQFVTREYTLYENYIVFKQTAPFLSVNMGMGQDLEIVYRQIANSNYSVTQEAYCNVQTGKIELIKAYGETVNHAPAYVGRKLEINMQMYIHDLVATDYQAKVDAVIRYVKAQAE